MRLQPAAWSVLAPGCFALAARVGARRVSGYSRRDEPVSALAAQGSPAAGVMVPGFLGLAAGTLGLAHSLRGSAVAPAPVPALLVAAGLTTAGAGLARCSDRTCPARFLGDEGATRSDDLHGLFSVATFVLWIVTPLVAARRAEGADDRYRRRSRRLGTSTAAVFLAGGLLARRPSKRWTGAAQRLMLASALAWFPVTGLAATGEPAAATMGEGT